MHVAKDGFREVFHHIFGLCLFLLEFISHFLAREVRMVRIHRAALIRLEVLIVVCFVVKFSLNKNLILVLYNFDIIFGLVVLIFLRRA